MVTSEPRMRTKLKRLETRMLCCGRKKGGRETTPDLATSPRRQPNPKHPPPMVVQPDFRKVSGISSEIFRQIESVENETDAATAAALEAVERRGEMVVRMLDTKQSQAALAARPFIQHQQDPKHPIHLVEIVKRPGQTLGLYIREGNGMDRSDGVFISRIALESSVYNSGCLKVGDEILAVNMVDVTRMSLDDVVIIMSIPRRLVLVTREGAPCAVGLQSQPHHKPLPVVVMKGQPQQINSREGSPSPRSVQESGRLQPSRSHLALGLQQDKHPNGELQESPYYTSRPSHHTIERGSWLYQPPPPPVVTEQPKSHHYQPYDKTYPKTLESLAEKDENSVLRRAGRNDVMRLQVHSFYPGGGGGVVGGGGGGGGGAPPPRRMSATTSSNLLSYYTTSGGGTTSGRSKLMPRSGSDQHLPRVEYSDFTPSMPTPSYRQYRSPSTYSTLSRRQRNVDYSSDTEASRPSYYYYRQHSTGPSSLSHQLSSTIDTSHSRISSLRSNSLPRDMRQPRTHIPTLPTHRSSTLRLDSHAGSVLLPPAAAAVSCLAAEHEDSDGALSAPEMTLSRKHRVGRLVSSPSVFSADEYRAWLTRTPSSSAIYSRSGGLHLANQKASQRFTFSAENLPQRTRQSELVYSTWRPGQLAAMGPVGKSASTAGGSLATRSASLRRMHNLLELEAKHLGKTEPPGAVRHPPTMHINPAEFLKYKQSVVRSGQAEVSGLLWLHLLSGRGLRASANPPTTTANLGSSNSCVRDLYCVLECDGVHKARTVVRTADLVFDWDETFELDLVSNRELDFLIYSWDPQYRHKLCYKGSVQLAALLQESPVHQLAVKIEPRGTLYLRLHHTTPYQTFLRKPKQPVIPSRKPLSGGKGIFGTDLEAVVNRESLASEILKGDALNIPTIVRRCVEEVERRGLDIIGLYRLCGSATKKRILREAFERNPRTVDLSPDNVPDINVITGVLKDYLRELPEPLVTKCLYQMLADAVSVCLPDDPDGNANLIFSILDCLPHVNRCTFVFLMNHLGLVASQTERNKMSTESLAVCFAPVLVLHSDAEDKSLDFHGPIAVVRYLLDIWPLKSAERAPIPPPRPCKAAEPPPLPAKPAQRPVVISSPVTSSSSDNEEEASSAFDAKANFDNKKSVFEKSVGGAAVAALVGEQPPKPNYDRKPVYSDGKPVYDRSGKILYEKKGSPPSERSAPAKSSSGYPAFSRNNPFAEEMASEETVETPGSSTGTEEGSRREADAEGSDDSVNLK